MLRRAFFIILTTFFLLSNSLSHALAQNPLDTLQNLPDPEEAAIEDYCNVRSGNIMNLETWYSGKCKIDGDLSTNDYMGEYRGFADIVILDLYDRLVGTNKDALENYFPISDNGILPGIGKLQASLFTSPSASSIDYLAHVGQNLQNKKLVKPAYAQNTGEGFVALKPVLNIWKGLRNIAYMFFILVFVLYGFMIMFRVKINPQTAVNIELAIPKIIATLLLITFSYAIAGFLIDISYFLSAIIVRALQASGAINLRLLPESINIKIGPLNESIPLDSIIQGIEGKTPETTPLPVNIVSGQSFGIFGIGLITFARVIIGSTFSQIASLLIGLPSWLIAIVSTVTRIAIVIKIILVVALAYSMLKLLLELVKSYATVMLLIIFSPIILLGNVMPAGRDGSAFDKWLRNLFAHIAVFPASLILFMIAATLLGPNSLAAGEDIWVPPTFLGGSDNPLFGIRALGTGTNSAKGAAALLGYAILLISPSFADMIRDSLGVKKTQYDKAIGESLGAGYDTQAKWAASGYDKAPIGDDSRNMMTNITKFGQKFRPTKGPDGKPIVIP